MSGWRRILVLLAVGAAGSLAALSISTSLSLFSATGAQQVNRFTAGTVTLTSGSLSGCQLTETSPTCTYQISYAGSLDAWIGVNVSGSTGAVTVTDTYDQSFAVPTLGSSTYEPVHGMTNSYQSAPFTDTFTVTLTAGGSGSVTLSAVAVQASNNTVCTGTTPDLSPLCPNGGAPESPEAWS